MAPTPSSSSSSKQPQSHSSLKTPQSKHRLNFTSTKDQQQQGDHPIEVIGRIRDHPNKTEKPTSILSLNPDHNRNLRVKSDVGYRDFTLDGVSFSEREDLDAFYKKFVESRIDGVKLGNNCTIMMYGPTGSGKSHTMFGCAKQQGIVYRSLKDILEGGGCGGNEEIIENGDGEKVVGIGTFVQVSVLEIYNEEIYDLLSSSGGGGLGFGWPKGGSASKVKLEVMGKKAKNATFISGTEAGKILKEIQKVEKRRIVKSTLCNDRSSRSHCMIIVDVPTVGGRLMLVDMAGSENIEQAGQNGFEAKMQTAKINQGNIALKRVVESIANGDSHVPFRDSKLTMLLQDSFEDDKSKILMILCASPDPKEIHKTICTLEYGAKAKCIVRGPHTPVKEKVGADESTAVILGSRIVAMDQFIYKLQLENKLREKERNEAHKQLMKKEEEVASLRALIEEKGSAASEEEINLKVNERTKMLKLELEKKLEECRRMAEEFVELERRRMEERILQQQQEVEMLRRRLEEIELELCCSRDGNSDVIRSRDMDGSSFARRLLGVYADEEPGMVKSMDLDMGDQDSFVREVKFADTAVHQSNKIVSPVVDHDVFASRYGDRVCLSTVFEEELEEEEEQNEKFEDEEVRKEIIEVKRIVDTHTPESGDTDASRRLRIQNIFALCGNYRELSQQVRTPAPAEKVITDNDLRSSPIMTVGLDSIAKSSEKENDPLPKYVSIVESRNNLSDLMALKENSDPTHESTNSQIEVHVKWETSKATNGKFITTLKVVEDATLADLRKLIEIYLGADNQSFSFLVLGDPTGTPVSKDKESTVLATKLPICNSQSHGHLACLRPANPNHVPLSPLPLTPLENKLPLTPIMRSLQHGDAQSPKVAPHLSTTPFITLRRH